MHLQVALPQSDYNALDTALLAACVTANLQAHPVFIEKIHQLYEMILVRHGLMLVGYSFGAKTSMYRMLATALGELCEKGLLEENRQAICTYEIGLPAGFRGPNSDPPVREH